MSVILNKDRSLSVTKFAKRLNYPRASSREFKRILKFLERNEYVVVQQGGFLGDNMHHNIIVTVRRPVELDRFKRVVLARVNYVIGEYTIHRAREKRKCGKCKYVISAGERYGAKAKIGKGGPKGHHCYAVSEICLPYLLEKQALDDLMEEA